jgi:hypothetical protein
MEGARTSVEPSARFPVWTDAGKARDALRLTTRIYNHRVQQSASELLRENSAKRSWDEQRTIFSSEKTFFILVTGKLKHTDRAPGKYDTRCQHP